MKEQINIEIHTNMMTNIKIIVNVQKKICIDNIKSPNREQIQIVQHKVIRV